MAYPPAKPRNREEFNEMSALLEALAANEDDQTPAMERFIETLTALILQHEEETGADRVQRERGGQNRAQMVHVFFRVAGR